MSDIMKTLREWKAAAFDNYYDGWTQNGFREKLIEVKEFVNDIENLKLHGDED